MLWGRGELRTRCIQAQAPLEETSVYNQCLNDWQLEISLKPSRFILPALRLKYLLGVCVYGQQSVGSGCRGSWVWLMRWGSIAFPLEIYPWNAKIFIAKSDLLMPLVAWWPLSISFRGEVGLERLIQTYSRRLFLLNYVI